MILADFILVSLMTQVAMWVLSPFLNDCTKTIDNHFSAFFSLFTVIQRQNNAGAGNVK